MLKKVKISWYFFLSWKSFKREMRFSSFAKKEKYDCCISLLLPKTEKYIHRISLFFCIYVTALNDYDDFDQSLPALGWLKETKSDTALSPHFHFHDDRRRSGWGLTGELYLSSGFGHPLSELLKECQIRQLWWWFQISVTFIMGPWRFLRLNGPVVSEFAFWTSPK